VFRLKFELSFKCTIETDSEKNEVSGRFSEDFKQLLAILSRMGMKNLSVSDIKVGELFDLYIKTNNVKEKSRDVYDSCFRCIFGRDYRNLSLSDINVDRIKLDHLSVNTKNYYVSVMSIFFNFACKKGFIYENPFAKLKQNKITQTARKALDCENWIFLSDAEREVTEFFSAFKKIKEYRRINLLPLTLLHMILATRVKETFRVIMFCSLTDEENKYIIIETKMTRKGMKPNYRLVLTDLAVFLIRQVQQQFKKQQYYKFYDCLRYVTKNFSNNMDIHGTRSLFRTIVELIPQTQSISFGAKETALGHETKNTVQKKYCRNDYYVKRYELQLYYSDFLLRCLDDDIDGVAVMREIVERDLQEQIQKKKNQR
jgi:exopolysaccharide biosynthesis protein